MYRLAEYQDDILPLIFRQLSSIDRLLATPVSKIWKAILESVSLTISEEQGTDLNLVELCKQRDYHGWMVCGWHDRSMFDAYGVFIEACKEGCLSIVKINPICVGKQTRHVLKERSKGLIVACRHGRDEIVLYLLDQRVKIADESNVLSITNNTMWIASARTAINHDHLLLAIKIFAHHNTIYADRKDKLIRWRQFEDHGALKYGQFCLIREYNLDMVDNIITNDDVIAFEQMLTRKN